MKNKVQYILILTIVIIFNISLFISCFNDENKTTFKSDFDDLQVTNLIGSEYLPNSLNEWKIVSGKMECIVSENNRSLKLLKRQVGNQRGSLEMSVQLGFYNLDLSNKNNNWVGFRIGSKEKNGDPFNYAIANTGIKIGICTNGAIFIGEPSPNYKNPLIIKTLSKGVDLKVIITPNGKYYTINAFVYDTTTKNVLANISKKQIAKHKLIGGLELVSNFESKDFLSQNNIKSVWFKDLIIEGTKLNRLQ